LEFWVLLIYRGRIKLETSNLAQRWTVVSIDEKNKTRSKGVMWGSRDTLLKFWEFFDFCEFWDPLIPPGRMKLETSNLAHICMAVSVNLGQKGSCWGSTDPLLEFRDPLIFLERLKLETSNLTHRCIAVSTYEKMQNWVKRLCGVT